MFGAAIALLGAGWLYRILAVTGDMHFDPVIYAQHAYNILQGTFSLKTDSWYAHRLPVFVPVVPFYALFGVGTWTSKAWPLALSLLQMALVLWVGWRRFGPAVALLGLGFVAFAPLDVLYSGVLNPDIVIATFMTAAAVLWIEAIEGPGRPSRLGLFLCGVSFALALLTRPFAILLGIFFLGHFLWRRPPWTSMLWPVLGGLLVLLPVGILYLLQTGDPLYRLAVVGGRYGSELKSEGSRFLYYPNLLLHPRHTVTGIVPHVLLVGVVGGIVRPNAKRALLLLWGLPILLYLQFGSMSASEYIPILKRERFLLPLFAPLFLLSADVLVGLCRWGAHRLAGGLRPAPDTAEASAVARTRAAGASRERRITAGLVGAGLTLYCAAGALVVRDQRAIGQTQADAFADVARTVRSWPDLPVLCDHWRTGYRLAYYLDFEEGADFYRGADDRKRMGAPGAFGDSRLGYLIWYPQAEALPPSLVVLDDDALLQARAGDSVTQTYLPEEIPTYAYSPPPSWQLVGRSGTFRVYLAPGGGG